jgi:hypothetical protein
MKKAAARVGLWSRNSRGCATVRPRSRESEGLGSIGPTSTAPTAASAWSVVGNAVMLLSLSIVNVFI